MFTIINFKIKQFLIKNIFIRNQKFKRFQNIFPESKTNVTFT